MESTAPRQRAGHAVFRQVFVPLLLALSALSWIFEAEGVHALAGAGIPMDFTTAVLLLTVALLWCAEWAYPQNPEWHYKLLTPGPRGWLSWGELFRDLFYLFIVAQLSAALIRFASSHLELAMHALGFGFGISHGLWPERAPFGVRVLLAFLLVELFSYWMHRAAHRVPWLWRFHSTHHLVSSLSALKSLRTHPVDNLFFYVARTVPLLLLGAGSKDLVAAVAFGGTLSLLAHANIHVHEGWLGWVVNFPRYHAVHHSLEVAESNSNFGCHTVLWDRLFRTFRERHVLPLVLGLRPRGWRSLWQELVRPLYRAP